MLSLLLALAATAGPAQTASKFTCPELRGSAQLLPEAGPAAHWPIIVMGELHGTAETPAMFGDLVCRAALLGPVNVHLEWAKTLTPLVDAYLASDGAAKERAKFFDHWQFQLKLPDGRTSEAMLALLERLRQLKAAGADIRVFCFQPDFAIRQNGDTQYYYELAMAREWVTPPPERLDARNLVLVGNIHSARHDYRNIGAHPAASYLREGDAILLQPFFQGGQSWTVETGPDGKLEAGPHRVGSEPKDGAPASERGFDVELGEGGDYDGTYSAGGPFSASPPVKP